MRPPGRSAPAPRGCALWLGAALLCLGPGTAAQQQTVGVFLNDPRAFPGYTLFAPTRSTSTYLVDLDGRQVHSWTSTATPGHAVYLLPGGSLLRTEVVANPTFRGTGGAGGRVRVIDWDGNLSWEFSYSSSLHLQHHDAKALPNGNVVLIAWEVKTAAEATAAGRDPALLTGGALWPDHLVEVAPDGGGGATVVWEWHLWDHLIQDRDPTAANFGVVGDHPELVDINFTSGGPGGGGADWTHVNSVAYNPDFDQLILSVHNLNEVWVIDHSTTTAEAAGHAGGRQGRGGDLLYRWGNPQAYRAGTAADRKLFGQHDAQWIPAGRPGAGNLLLFNNGVGRPGGAYSTVDEWVPPVDASGQYALVAGQAYGPAALAWTYAAPNPPDLFAQNISGTERQPNGTTLLCDGPKGTFHEVTGAGEAVWRYVNPVTDLGPLTQGDPIPSGPGGRTNTVFKVRRYAATDPELAGRDLSPGGPVESYVLLRNTEVTSLSPLAPPLSTIFTASGPTTLDPVADAYLRPFRPGGAEPDAAICDPARPLVFYQINSPSYVLRLAREPVCTLRFSF